MYTQIIDSLITTTIIFIRSILKKRLLASVNVNKNTKIVVILKMKRKQKRI